MIRWVMDWVPPRWRCVRCERWSRRKWAAARVVDTPDGTWLVHLLCRRCASSMEKRDGVYYEGRLP